MKSTKPQGPRYKLTSTFTMLTGILGCFSAFSTTRAALVTRDVNVTLNARNFDSYDLDLDLNGMPDFHFDTAYSGDDPSFIVAFDEVKAADNLFGTISGVQVDMVTGDGFPTATQLQQGAIISSTQPFSMGSSDEANLVYTTPFDPTSGNFNGQSGYIGLRFVQGGNTYYGFAQITVNSLDDPTNPLDLHIGQVGYNDVADQAVTAVPEPSTFALIGAAGAGVFFIRRKRNG